MPPRTTVWELDEQTRGKHEVLRCYLNAWLPILGMTQEKIVFIDGFAGPGQYTGGEEGSPIIALKALINHASLGKITADVFFLFFEKDEARAAHLTQLVEDLRPSLPATAKVQVRTGQFHVHMTELLAGIRGGYTLVPSLVMIDPFGISDIPMDLIGQIMKNSKAEVYVTLMWEFIYRFRDTPEFERHLDELFGTPEWRRYIDLADDACCDGLFALYEDQLRQRGAKHVVHFDLYKGNRHVYTIFHATKHPKGCNMMKAAIWKAVPAGDYEFRAATASGQLLIQMAPNMEPLKSELAAAFASAGPVSIEDLQEWIQTDATSFHLSHLKTTLKEMEAAGTITVTGKPGRRKGSFPDGTIVQFVTS